MAIPKDCFANARNDTQENGNLLGTPTVASISVFPSSGAARGNPGQPLRSPSIPLPYCSIVGYKGKKRGQWKTHE